MSGDAVRKERWLATPSHLGCPGGRVSAGSIPGLLIHPLTKHRQRDGGEELGQPRGEPKPHAEQSHQVHHSPRASLGEEEMPENTTSSSTLQGFYPAGAFSSFGSQLKHDPPKKHSTRRLLLFSTTIPLLLCFAFFFFLKYFIFNF